jgi:hypothetical protein
MKRVRLILRVLLVGLVLAGAGVLVGCDRDHHVSYRGRDHGPVYSRGHGSSGWNAHPGSGGFKGGHDSKSFARR